MKPPFSKCYATLAIRSDSPGHAGRSWKHTEPALLALFTTALLNHTSLPIFIMHNAAVDPIAALSGAVSSRLWRAQVHAFEVAVLKPPVRAQILYRHYEHMYTKLHAWRLPCRQVMFVDYDVVALHTPDEAFAVCGDANLCAVHDGNNPKIDRFNAGVFVLQPSNDTYRKLHDYLKNGTHRTAVPQIEQDLLNRFFREWRPLPSRFNVQGVASGKPYKLDSDVFVHEKYYEMPTALRAHLHIPPSLPEPSWLDHIVQFLLHFW